MCEERSCASGSDPLCLPFKANSDPRLLDFRIGNIGSIGESQGHQPLRPRKTITLSQEREDTFLPHRKKEHHLTIKESQSQERRPATPTSIIIKGTLGFYFFFFLFFPCLDPWPSADQHWGPLTSGSF